MGFFRKIRRISAFILLFAMLLSIFPVESLAVQGEEKQTSKAASTAQNQAEEIRQRVDTLSPPVGAVKNGNLLVDLTGYLTVAGSHTPLDFLSGRYYLATLVDGYYYLFDGSATPSSAGTVIARKKTADGQSVAGVNKTQTMLFYSRGVNQNKDTSYAIGFGRGNYMESIAEGAKIVATETKGRHAGWIWSTDQERIIINNNLNHADGTYTRHCIALSSDKSAFFWSPITNEQSIQTGSDYERLYVFRYCYNLQELYNAMQSAKSYLDRPEGVSDEMYQNLLDSYTVALELYETYNVTSMTEDLFLRSEYIQSQIDAMRKEILSYDKLLDSSLAYLDLPIEVMDFRADGYLFENPTTFKAPYNLSRNSPAVTLPDGSTMSRPGSLEWDKTSNKDSDLKFYVAGLVEPRLVNGSMVYTPDVIKYIANALMSTSYDPNDAYKENWNDNFYTKKRSSDFRLGTWEETLAKIEYTNGNPLTWNEVETAYDLAYYMLLYVWRPTEAGDYLEEDTPVNSGTMDIAYNTVIEELKYLRLYYNSASGNYEFSSYTSHSRSGGYIFNDGLNRLTQSPSFNVAHDLGFEREDVFDPTTTGTSVADDIVAYKADANYFYSLHAGSKFVYYKDKNYYFDFTGDDDVYFFINDTLICDIGGIHGSPNRSVYLEEKMENSDLTYAQYLGLKDGDICSFDMFFADRHLTGINLSFKTNIHLLNEDVNTFKNQYVVRSEGQDILDPGTGLGDYKSDNSIINIGDTVAYSFDLLNKGKTPVNRVSFKDESLGAELSYEAVLLGDRGKTNGAVTEIGDLQLYYSAYDPQEGTCTASAEDQSFAQIADLLEELNQTVVLDGKTVYPAFAEDTRLRFVPQGTVTYTDKSSGKSVTLTEVEQIKFLLDLGVPAGCELKIYGLKRNTVTEDKAYRNVLRSAWYDRDKGNSKSEGIATRSLRVPDLSNNILPEADVVEVVLDYGKPVLIPYSDLYGHIFVSNGQSVGELVGVTKQGSHMDFLRTLPENVACKTGEDILTTDCGYLSRTETGLVFTLTKMLDKVEKVRAIYALEDCFGQGTNGTSVEYHYMLLEIQLTPATVVYYETDFADGIFHTEQVGPSTGAWTTAPEGAQSSGEYQDYDTVGDTVYDMTIDTEHIPSEAFFADFDGTGNAERYSVNPLYKGVNFDTAAGWNTLSNASGKPQGTDGTLTKLLSVDQAQGVLNVEVGDSYYVLNGVNYGYGPHIRTYNDSSASLNPIHLSPEKDSYVQVRFKLDNCRPVEEEDLTVIFVYNGTKNGTGTYHTKEAHAVVADYDYLREGYVTVRMPIVGNDTAPLWYDMDFILGIGFRFKNIRSRPGEKAYVVIDHIYVGPETGTVADLYNDNCLYFGFENTTADTNRYKKTEYGKSYKYDGGSTPNWSMGYGTNNKGFSIANGALAMKVEIDEDNELRLATTMTYGTYPFHGSYGNKAAHPLKFPSKYAKYFQIRLKFENCVPNKGTPHLKTIYYYYDKDTSDGKGSYVWGDTITLTSLPGDYTTYTVYLEDNFTENIEIDAVALAFYNIDSQAGSEGTITIDYMYVGDLKESGAPSRNLFFGYGNTEEDKARYDSKTYGYQNFDTFTEGDQNTGEYYWATAYGTTSEEHAGYGYDFTIDHEAGTLTGYFSGQPMSGTDHAYRLDLLTTKEPGRYYYESTYDNDVNMPLYYRPNEGDVVQIRMKLANLIDGSEEDGHIETWDPEMEAQWDLPGIDVRLNYVKDGELQLLTQRNVAAKVELDAEGYQILTMALPKEVITAEYIRAVDVRFWHMKATERDEGTVTIDYIYVGPGDAYEGETVYGYDSSYVNDRDYSDGTSLFVMGNGVRLEGNNKKYTECSFDFLGTGFDLISRTGVDQATIRVEIRNKATGTVVKTMTVNNKGELELYQIPVVSVNGLDYGTYTVTVWVNEAISGGIEFLRRGGEFYFDAVRIYDPLNAEEGQDDDSRSAVVVYEKDGEAYAEVTEIRDLLLSQVAFSALKDQELTGGVFVDAKENPDLTYTDQETGQTVTVSAGTEIDAHHTLIVSDYKKVGPKNEVYLDSHQAVAFKLEFSSKLAPVSVDIGAKTLNGNPVSFAAGFVSAGSAEESILQLESSLHRIISTPTAQYYALRTQKDLFFTNAGEQKDVYLVIYNTTENSTGAQAPAAVLSVTDLKVAYGQKPTQEETVTFMVDNRTVKAAAVFLRDYTNTPVLEEGLSLMHSLDLAESIYLNYVISKEQVKDYDSFFLRCTVPQYLGNVQTGTTTVELQGEERGAYYYFTLKELSAVNLSDVISAQLVLMKNGTQYYSEEDHYSIAQYAYGQLNKEAAGLKLKTLCAELLRYGTWAQLYKEYRTDSLADGNMTAEHRAYLRDMETVTFGSVNEEIKDQTKALLVWEGKTLSLDSKVSLKFIFSLGTYAGDLEDLCLHVSYEDMQGESVSLILKDLQVYNATYGRYAFTLDALMAAELRSAVSVQVYAGEDPVSSILRYSADTYGRNKTGTLGELCKALFAYSDSAKAYFSA